MQLDRTFSSVDISSIEFWAGTAEQREERFALLRENEPVSWQPPAEGGLAPDPNGPGHWAVVRHADVVEVSRRSEVYCSSRGVNFEDFPPELLEMVSSILGMDDPRHAQIRRLIASAFTPRQLAKAEAAAAARAAAIVDEFLAAGPCNFVEQVSGRLPVWAISEMLGIAQEDRERMAAAVQDLVSWNDPAVQAGREPEEVMFEAFLEVSAIGVELMAARREAPADDIMSELANATVDGERLSDDDIASFFVFLAAAGTDTTRQSASYGLRALYAHPEQRKVLAAEPELYLAGAVDEMIRWTTPVHAFRRNAMTDTELGGRSIRAGDKVVMFYAAANRDAAVFDRPNDFDITRKPNPHVSFGGGGTHYCLGASLARMQLRALTAELVQRVPDIEFGEPTFIPSNFVHGISDLPCRPC